jgi:hypothetical protein
MTTIINKTPHAVNILDANNDILTTFAKSDNPIRLSVVTVDDIPIGIIPISKTEFGKVENLDEFKENVYYIVSQLVKSALPNRTDLLVPSQVVRDENGNIIGCKSLGR